MDEKGSSFCKFVQMSVAPKELEIFNPAVKTKEYDGKRRAELDGTLVGVISGDRVKAVYPTAILSNADAGTWEVEVSGEASLGGTDAKNYSLKECSFKGLSGTVLKKVVKVIAISNFSVQGEEMAALSYSTGTGDEKIKGVKLHCSASNQSSPGDYPITVEAPKSKNYEYKCVPGIYTILPREDDVLDDFGYGQDTEDDGTDDKDSTVFDSYLTEPEDEWDWTQWIDGMDDEEQDGGGQDGEGQDGKPGKDKKSEKVLVNLFDVSRGIKMDGLYKIDTGSLKANENVLVLKYWISRTGTLTASDGVKVRKGKKGPWVKKLDFVGDSSEDYLSAVNFSFYAKCGSKVVRCRVNKFVCDRAAPTVALDGIGLSGDAEEPITFNTALSVGVNVIFGITGRSMLSYKLVTSENAELDSEEGWKLISGNEITIDQEFSGQLAVRTEDALGNYTVVYTQPFIIDTAAPTIDGVEFGGVYQDTVSYSVTDQSGVQSVIFDGKAAEETGTVMGGGVHTIAVTDVNGNSQSVTFTCEDSNFINKILHHFKSLK